MTFLSSAAPAAAVADHRRDPHAHPELLHLRQAVTSAGIAFDPADPTQLYTAMEQTAEVAVDAAAVAHMQDPAAHPELRQVRRVVTSTGVAFDPGSGGQLQAAIDRRIDTALTAGLALHGEDPFAHPEQQQVRAVITGAGLVYDPADPSQLAEAIARTVRAAPPGGPVADGAPSLTATGFRGLPGGLMLQWGEFYDTAQALPPGGRVDRAVAFPVAFPVACFQVLVCPAADHLTVCARSHGRTGFLPVFSADACGAMALGLRYLAIGI
ncbi:gp53-like domain-containing protein [Novispirillum itersonii]|uniref:Putative tail fiber protein gp53-like C-terminal domain-containing protein n=1 Tax=Novispirillum itersonii TaxID=189 RepID=A0A7W9ZDU1_NOVIT|nr:hypothetical protein [Novispirillum itersonii]MBB6208797.1 hypothetical protein [Novispirillum itersonii]